MIQHYLKFSDVDAATYDYLFERALWIKKEFKAYRKYWPLTDRYLVMIFDKASTRTRLSFEIGMQQLGGKAIFLNAQDSQLGRGEPLSDSANVISRMCDIIMIRTYEQGSLQCFAETSSVPVINGLTNEHHPCQVMADIMTFQEKNGPIAGKTVAWIGDGNNMCHSWAQAAHTLGFYLHISNPPGYELPYKHLIDNTWVHQFAQPHDAVSQAHIVTTDVWTSMGFEAENERRRQAFTDWQVTADLLKLADKQVNFMHCLPAHRGEEVSAEVIDGEHSVVWDEAENRLHVQKALLEYLLLGKL